MFKLWIALFVVIGLVLPDAHLQAQTSDASSARETWRTATGYMRAGAPRKALPLLEHLVIVAPENTEIRLELALAYFRVEDDKKSKFHFEQTLDKNLEDAKRKAVLRYLRTIENRRNWEASLSFAIVPESNASKRTSSETINLGGLDFVLNETASAGTGLNLNTRLAYTPRITRDVSARFAVSASGTLFETTEWNDYTLRGEAGLVLRSDLDREFSTGVFVSQRWLGDHRFSQDYGGFASASTRVTKDIQIALRGEIGQRKTPSVPGRDGQVYSLSASAVKVISPRFNIRLRGFAVNTDAAKDYESGMVVGLGLGGTYLFEGGWQTNLNATYSQERRFGDAPVFNVARRENQFDVKLQVLNRKIQKYGYSPALEIGLEQKRSNISLFSYENTYVSIGLSREF